MIAFEFSFTWNQVVAGSSKQATVGDSGLTIQNTMDDIEQHLMSLAAVNIKYNVQTKNITEIGLF